MESSEFGLAEKQTKTDSEHAIQRPGSWLEPSPFNLRKASFFPLSPSEKLGENNSINKTISLWKQWRKLIQLGFKDLKMQVRELNFT